MSRKECGFRGIEVLRAIDVTTYKIGIHFAASLGNSLRDTSHLSRRRK
jgi:hypothetical protein